MSRNMCILRHKCVMPKRALVQLLHGQMKLDIIFLNLLVIMTLWIVNSVISLPSMSYSKVVICPKDQKKCGEYTSKKRKFLIEIILK